MSNTESLATSANHLADQAAQGAEAMIRSTQRAASGALDSRSSSVDDLHARATPKIHRVAGSAEAMARRGLDAVRASSSEVRDRAARASDSTLGYIKGEPVKAMLIAAAAGAALMALVSLLGRSNAADR